MTTATMAAEADLITHEWNENQDCITPDVVEVPFGPKSKGRALTFYLGSTAGRWHVGWHAITKDDEDVLPCSAVNQSYANRAEALRAGLVATAVKFANDKHASKSIEAFFEKLGEKPTLICSFAANEGEPMRPPLPKGRFAELPVGSIAANPENHRKHFDEIAMAQLTASIREHGLLQPIAVRLLTPEEAGVLPGVDEPRYEIILGERRWRAHLDAKLPTIDAKVYEGVTRGQAKAAALVENLQRQDINAIEEAEGYRDLMEAEGLTQEEVALRVGRSRPAVANAVRLLNLPSKVLEAIRRGDLTPAHGMALARFRPKKDELFPTWRQVVEVIAEEAILNKMPAGSLEEGVPCVGSLSRAGLIVRCNVYEVGGEWPAAIEGHPAYINNGTWEKYCFEPEHWCGLVKAHRAEREAAAERERAKAEEAVKKGSKAKIKSLEDLPDSAYEVVNYEEQPELSELLPEKRMLTDLPEEAEGQARVTVCLAPRFADRVEKALLEAKREDLKAKLPALFEEAREKIRRIRKIDARITALMIAACLENEEWEPFLSSSSAKAQGVALPKTIRVPDETNRWHRLPAVTAKLLSALADDAVGYARVLLDDWLCRQLADDHWEADQEPTLAFGHASPATREILCYLLEVPNLGLLEETKAGRKKLIEKVRALDWYAPALAEAIKNGDMGAGNAEGGEENED